MLGRISYRPNNNTPEVKESSNGPCTPCQEERPPQGADDGWRIPDALWQRLVPLLPPRKPHPLGCHRPRVDDRQAMAAIFCVLRTGCQGNALNATGLCSSSSAPRRCQEWTAADVFMALWEQGLVA